MSVLHRTLGQLLGIFSRDKQLAECRVNDKCEMVLGIIIVVAFVVGVSTCWEKRNEEKIIPPTKDINSE